MRGSEVLKKPDYSEWLNDPWKFNSEIRKWYSSGYHWSYAAHIAYLCSKFPIKRMLEIGCGIGLVPANLSHIPLNYVGIDKNPDVITMARATSPASVERLFIVGDIRNYKLKFADLVCAFAVLKHFGLDEWDSVFVSMLNLTLRVGLFTMHVSDQDTDDGVEFHHTWVTKDRLLTLIERAGFSVLYITTIWKGQPWENKRFGEEWLFAVEKKYRTIK